MKAVGVIAAVAAIILLTLLASGKFSSDPSQPGFPGDGPAEFLYLDGSRVLAYLAQFDGGKFTSEQLTRESSETQSGKLAVQALELGETVQQKQSLSRTITPTAAGNYIELLAKLKQHGLKTIGLRHFGEQVRGLSEGQFVTFRTHALSSPVYLSPYLAVRERKTLSTLFPMPAKGEPGRQAVRRERKAARRFRERLGRDPRVVFALRPAGESEDEEEVAAGGGEEKEEEASPPALRRGEHNAIKRVIQEDKVEYLMPLDAQLISKERSLLKFGGGEFTVVGKVVRIFPEDGDGHVPAYVDSPTLETWERPLADAPPVLLCRTDPKCSAEIRTGSSTAWQREDVIRGSRVRAIEALTKQTAIPKRGAVIVPIAIYK
ncbi:MAG TPA: hypothetical protein VFJ64_05915 [Solirubrobacterales bacterium]|nr:hypothetical protein [Solirubrobacterales bacterium]